MKSLPFLDTYFGVLDSDLRASPPPPMMFSYGVPPGGIIAKSQGYPTKGIPTSYIL